MPRHVALLRGINVGGHRVKMDRLRDLFDALGFADVATFIASGNVLFVDDEEDIDVLRERIEAHLAAQLGYPVATFLRSPAQLAEIVHADLPPMRAPGSDPVSHYVMFLREAAEDMARNRLEPLNSPTDDFHFSGTEVHWRIRSKLSESPLFGGGFERATRDIPNTMRNVTSLTRLLAKTGWTE